MSTKKKAPTKAQLDARAKFTKMVKEKAAAKKKAGMNAPTKRTTAKKLCSSVIKREGVKTDGTLKKGYKYAKGGKVVKATPVKSVKKKVVTKKGLKAVKKLIEFTFDKNLNENLNKLFSKLGKPRIKTFYAIIGKDVYFVRRDIPYTTAKAMKETPSGKVIPMFRSWSVKKERDLTANEIERLKKGKHYILDYKVNTAF